MTTMRKQPAKFKPGDLVKLDPDGDEYGNKLTAVLHFRTDPIVDYIGVDTDGALVASVSPENMTELLEVICQDTDNSVLVWCPKYAGYEVFHESWLKKFNAD